MANGLFWPACLRIRPIRKLTPNSPATRTAGESVRRPRHARARDLAQQGLAQPLNRLLVIGLCRRLVGRLMADATSAAALATLSSVFPSNSCRWLTTHSSMRSVSSSTSNPERENPPDAGCCGLRQRIGRQIIDGLLVRLHPRDVVASRVTSAASPLDGGGIESAAAWRSESSARILDHALLEDHAEGFPEFRIFLPACPRRVPRSRSSDRFTSADLIFSTVRLFCSNSRETLRGRSALSTRPRMKRNQGGNSSAALSMMKTRLT